jgi:hypothetical protein
MDSYMTPKDRSNTKAFGKMVNKQIKKQWFRIKRDSLDSTPKAQGSPARDNQITQGTNGLMKISSTRLERSPACQWTDKMLENMQLPPTSVNLTSAGGLKSQVTTTILV